MTALETPPEAVTPTIVERPAAPTLEVAHEPSHSTGTLLDDHLQRHLDTVAALLPDGADGAALHTALTLAIGGGKRFRPRLVADVHAALRAATDATGTVDALDRTDELEAVAAVAAGVELLHTAFVVHDDVIDGDDVRRGAPSVPGRFRRGALAEGADHRAAGTRAVAGAVLTGDLALVQALRAFAEAPVGPDVRARLLDLAGEAIAVSAVGELTDVRLASPLARPSDEEVLALAERKTAWYSFSLPMQLGAVLAGASDDVVDALGEAGLLLGTAFQLLDDLAGTFGNAEATGKSTVADLREGKATLLVTHARTTAWWPLLAPYWGNEYLTEDAAATARALLERCGARRHVEEVAAEHLAAGLDRVAGVGVSLDTLAWMAGLSDRCRTGAA